MDDKPGAGKSRLFPPGTPPLIVVGDLAAGDVTAIGIQIDVGVIPDKVPVEAGFQASDEFIGGLHPKHENLVPPIGLGDQGRPQDVADGGTVVKGVVIRLFREVQEHIVFQFFGDGPEERQEQIIAGAIPVAADGVVVQIAEAGLNKPRLLFEKVVQPTLPPQALPVRSSWVKNTGVQ